MQDMRIQYLTSCSLHAFFMYCAVIVMFVILQLACKSSLDNRAIELVQMLGNSQILNLAIKYASKQNRRLAEKLLEIAPSIGDENGESNSFISVSISIQFRK